MKCLFLRNQKGFTLVELMVVLAVILVLVALLLPKLLGSSDKKNAAAISRNVEKIVSGLSLYRADIGKYPDQLVALWDRSKVSSTDISYWRGPYMDIPEKVDAQTGNVLDANVSEVSYSFVKITSSGGSGSCSSAEQIGMANAGGTDYTVKVANVPLDVARIIKQQFGQKICVSSDTNDSVDVYFPFDEKFPIQ
jgi:general secretion pathway protein G